MKAGDLIQFTVPGNRDEKAEIVRGLVIKDVGFNVCLRASGAGILV